MLTIASSLPVDDTDLLLRWSEWRGTGVPA